jgi:hypothetical protein
VALPPVPLGGINSFATLRAVVEAEHWAERLEGGAGILLAKTRGEVVRMIAKHGKGVVKDAEEKVDCLLMKVGGYEKVRVRSAVWKNMPERMLPLTEEGERVIIESLVGELKDNFGVRISRCLQFSRAGTVEQPVHKYAVIGGSNADRIGDVLKDMKKDVVKITKSGWRPSKQGVLEILELMGKVDLTDRVVIIYGMDNGTFYAEDEDGDRALPKPGKDGIFHVKGKVEVATEKQVKGLVYNCGKILEILVENNKILVTPGVRFFREPCCPDKGHCVNLEEGGYRRGMLEDLARLKEAVEEVCREEGMSRFKVVSPSELLGIRAVMDENELIQILGGDAVHMAPRGYRQLGECFVRMVESQKATFTGGKRDREEEEESDNGGIVNFHRRRHEWLYNVVSGEGGWKPAQVVKMSGQPKGGAAGRSGASSGPGKGPFGQNFGPMGGNN